jgi:hypothetical protein
MRRSPRVLIAQLEHDVCFDVDPRASRLWPGAPPHLKRDYVYGYVDADSFWRQLRRWLEFEERIADGDRAA